MERNYISKNTHLKNERPVFYGKTSWFLVFLRETSYSRPEKFTLSKMKIVSNPVNRAPPNCTNSHSMDTVYSADATFSVEYGGVGYNSFILWGSGGIKTCMKP